MAEEAIQPDATRSGGAQWTEPVDTVLDERVAVVTGASGGIGRELGRRLARSGAHLLLTYSGHAQEAGELAEEARGMGRRAETVHADFADPSAPATVVDAALAGFGRVDVLVAAAGAATRASWSARTTRPARPRCTA
jgi:3-oxoacyl-[acyl-carrier protein] reductase